MRTSLAILAVFLGLIVLASTAVLQTSPAGAVPDPDPLASLVTGPQIYRAACASCHDARGVGVPGATLGFDVDPPDFTDCAFTSRETEVDWVGVVSLGGPVKAFSPLMPAFEQALTRPQIETVVHHVKAFCPEPGWPRGELNFPKALNTGKAFPENEVAWSMSSSTKEPVSIAGKLVVAKRLGDRHQIEAVLPFGLQQIDRTDASGRTTRTWGGGAKDVGLAYKGVLWHSAPAGHITALTLDVFLPTGDELEGMSNGVVVIEPALAMGQVIPKVGFIQAQVGAELSTDPDRQSHALFWRAVLGRSFRGGEFGRLWSPMIEVMGAADFGDVTEVSWDIVPQLQVALSTRQHVRLGLGPKIPITDFDARSIVAMMYVMWDWYDGGLTEGW